MNMFYIFFFLFFWSYCNLLINRVVLAILVSIQSTFETNLWYILFLRTSFFTTSLSILRGTETVFSSSWSNLSTLDFKFFNVAGEVFNSAISVLSISNFKPAKSTVSAKRDLSATCCFFYIRFCSTIRKILVNFCISV